MNMRYIPQVSFGRNPEKDSSCNGCACMGADYKIQARGTSLRFCELCAAVLAEQVLTAVQLRRKVDVTHDL